MVESVAVKGFRKPRCNAMVERLTCDDAVLRPLAGRYRAVAGKTARLGVSACAVLPGFPGYDQRVWDFLCTGPAVRM